MCWDARGGLVVGRDVVTLNPEAAHVTLLTHDDTTNGGGEP